MFVLFPLPMVLQAFAARPRADPLGAASLRESDGAPPLMPSQATVPVVPWPLHVCESEVRRPGQSSSCSRSIPDETLAAAVVPQSSALAGSAAVLCRASEARPAADSLRAASLRGARGAPAPMPSQASVSCHRWPPEVRHCEPRPRGRSRSPSRSIPGEALAGALGPQTSALARFDVVPCFDGHGSAVARRPEWLVLQHPFLRAEGSTMPRELLAACVEVLRVHFVQIEPGLVPDMSDFYVRAAVFLPAVVHVEYGRYRQAGAAVWAHRPPSPNSGGAFRMGSHMSSALVDACVLLWRCGGAVAFGVTCSLPSPRVLGGHFSADFVRIEFDRSCGQAANP